MPKKNKGGKNGFYYFMLEFKDRQGRNYNNMVDVAEAAGPHWQRMSKEQKRPYEIRAQMEKNNVQARKFTSEGLDVEVLEQMERAEQQKIQEMKEEINEELKMANRANRIHDKMFFLIHINTFCHVPTENRHYPAEIGIAGFTLENGVLDENVFHRILQPGPLPLGFAGIANLHSRETHQLQTPLPDDLDTNLNAVYIEMKSFLRSKMEGSKRMPILYCEDRHMKMVQLVLDTWSMDYDEGQTVFKAYNLQYMFRILKNTVAGDNVWPSDTYSVREIEKDVNAYAKDICCDYHDQSNVSIYCSRSVVVRYAFTICDNCCPDLNIPLIPGCHVPAASFTTISSRPSSAASVASSKSSLYRGNNSSAREDDSGSVLSFSSKSEWESQSVTTETSSSHAIHDEDDFPTLGTNRKKEMFSSTSWNRFSPSDSSSTVSQPTMRSYAGATGTSGLSRRPADMPSSVVNSMEKLSFNSSRSSETQSAGHGTNRSNDASSRDFPSLGRGRGGQGQKPRGRGLRRPNSDQ